MRLAATCSAAKTAQCISVHEPANDQHWPLPVGSLEPPVPHRPTFSAAGPSKVRFEHAACFVLLVACSLVADLVNP